MKLSMKQLVKNKFTRKIKAKIKKVTAGVKTQMRPSFIDEVELEKKLSHFSVKKAAILVDSAKQIHVLKLSPMIQVMGYYSFSLDLIGEKINGFEVQALLENSLPVDCDGWIIAAQNPLVGYALSQHLLSQKSETQVMIWFAQPPKGVRYYSYIDFFSNEQQTIVQIGNYLDFCYRLPYSLAIQYTLRDCDGRVKKTGQIIIPPNGIRLISSSDFEEKDFVGYLELEFEVESKITPFLHYTADYFSKDSISTNHQSGLGLHAAHSIFSRGYIPVEADKTLEMCIFQKHYTKPVQALAHLKYFDLSGEKKKITAKLPLVSQKQMLFVDIKKLFSSVNFEKVQSPYCEIESEKPLHRPNYYFKNYSKKGYYDTSHTGPDLRINNNGAVNENLFIPKPTLDKLTSFNCDYIGVGHVILPEKFQIDSYIGMGEDTTAPLNKIFLIKYFDFSGRVIFSKEMEFDFEKNNFFNLNAILKSEGIVDQPGFLELRPIGKKIPLQFTAIAGFKYRQGDYLTTTVAPGLNVNIPFYFWNSPGSIVNSKLTPTEIFCRGVSNDELDTIVMIFFQSASRSINKKIEYDVHIFSECGQRTTLRRSINAHGSDIFSLKEQIVELKISNSSDRYTIWLTTPEVGLSANHLLIRKDDHAIALDHFYSGKFGEWL